MTEITGAATRIAVATAMAAAIRPVGMVRFTRGRGSRMHATASPCGGRRGKQAAIVKAQLSKPTLSTSVEAALRLAAIFEIGSESALSLP